MDEKEAARLDKIFDQQLEALLSADWEAFEGSEKPIFEPVDADNQVSSVDL